MNIRNLSIALVTFTLSIAACGKDEGGGSVCEKAVDNTMKLVKEAFPDAPSKNDRKEMLARCAEQPAEKQKCAAEAKTMEDLMKCGA